MRRGDKWNSCPWLGALHCHFDTQHMRSNLKFELRLQDENKAEGRTPPSGVVVFRRGKLPLRVGMPMEEFTQVWGQKWGGEAGRELTSCWCQ